MKDEIIESIKDSKLFDEEWYKTVYPDVIELEISPVWHYIELGWKMKRDPSPAFSTAKYLEMNPEVKRADINPLYHYIKYGKNEGREIFPSSVSCYKKIIKDIHDIADKIENIIPNFSSNEKELDSFNKKLDTLAIKSQLQKTQEMLEKYYIKCQDLNKYS